MKILKRTLLTVIFLAVYCNIGYGIGTVVHITMPHTDNHLTQPAGHIGTFFAGPGNLLDRSKVQEHSLFDDRLFDTFLWPIDVLMPAVLWLVVGIVKLIFMGGLVKLCRGLYGFLLILALIAWIIAWMRWIYSAGTGG